MLKTFDKQLSKDAKRIESSQQLVQSVTTDIGAVGFVGVAHIGNSKLLNIANSVSEKGTKPGPYTIGTQSYPLSRKLFLYTSSDKLTPLVKDFIQFSTGDTAQKLAEKTGLVSYFPTINTPDFIKKDTPIRYKDLAAIGQRITVSFSSEKTHPATELRDITRLKNYLKQNNKHKVVLVNFAISDRIQEVSQLLLSHNIPVLDALTIDSKNEMNEQPIEVWLL